MFDVVGIRDEVGVPRSGAKLLTSFVKITTSTLNIDINIYGVFLTDIP